MRMAAGLGDELVYLVIALLKDGLKMSNGSGGREEREGRRKLAEIYEKLGCYNKAEIQWIRLFQSHSLFSISPSPSLPLIQRRLHSKRSSLLSSFPSLSPSFSSSFYSLCETFHLFRYRSYLLSFFSFTPNNQCKYRHQMIKMITQCQTLLNKTTKLIDQIFYQSLFSLVAYPTCDTDIVNHFYSSNLYFPIVTSDVAFFSKIENFCQSANKKQAKRMDENCAKHHLVLHSHLFSLFSSTLPHHEQWHQRFKNIAPCHR